MMQMSKSDWSNLVNTETFRLFDEDGQEISFNFFWVSVYLLSPYQTSRVYDGFPDAPTVDEFLKSACTTQNLAATWAETMDKFWRSSKNAPLMSYMLTYCGLNHGPHHVQTALLSVLVVRIYLSRLPQEVQDFVEGYLVAVESWAASKKKYTVDLSSSISEICKIRTALDINDPRYRALDLALHPVFIACHGANVQFHEFSTLIHDACYFNEAMKVDLADFFRSALPSLLPGFSCLRQVEKSS